MTDLTQTVLRNIMVSTYSAEASVKQAGDFFDTEQQAVERFAWLPTETNTGKVVWLCKYIEVRYYLEWRHQPHLVHDMWPIDSLCRTMYCMCYNRRNSMFGQTDEEYTKEAREVARRTTDDPTLQKYIEGEVFRIKKMSDKLDRLYLNFWLLVFLIFVLPIFLRG